MENRQPQCLRVYPETKSLADKKKCLAVLLLLTTVFKRDSYINLMVILSHGKMSTKSLCLVMLMFARTA